MISKAPPRLMPVGERFPDGCVKRAEEWRFSFTVPVTTFQETPNGPVLVSKSHTAEVKGTVQDLLADQRVREILKRGEGITTTLVEGHKPARLVDALRVLWRHLSSPTDKIVGGGCIAAIGAGLGAMVSFMAVGLPLSLFNLVTGGPSVEVVNSLLMGAMLAGVPIGAIGLPVFAAYRCIEESVEGLMYQEPASCGKGKVMFLPKGGNTEYPDGVPIPIAEVEQHSQPLESITLDPISVAVATVEGKGP